ncbi:cytochrome-c peroxidase [Desertibaculum subflavum]|uniref:cytochrome-c peroxidase n=1 Tax=Desertibaculum subflavum TaxID=2268458 RepID=UPI000E670C77
MRAALAGLIAALLAAAAVAAPVRFDEAETRRILRHGPWPPAVPADPSNRVAENPAAIELGRRLFFDKRLSADGTVACATCHAPALAWTDGKPRAATYQPLHRNTPTVLNAGLGRWFGWDGGADSLWAQSIRPILSPQEMGGSAAQTARRVAGDPALTCLARASFGAPAESDEAALVRAAKAIAAFVATMVSPRTPFDAFRDALAEGDAKAMARYPQAAQRGLKLFVGKGCPDCHFGPAFTNGEFHDVGVPHMPAPGMVDFGRHGGLKILAADRFNRLGPWSDDAEGEAAALTRRVRATHTDFGRFKVPSLREAARTAPYMHDGRYASLRDAVRHYSELDMNRLHVHGEQLLRPLRLKGSEIDDLVAFLESLSAPKLPEFAPARYSACP